MSTTILQNEQNLHTKENSPEQNNLAQNKARLTNTHGVPPNKPPLSLSHNQFANSRGLSNRNSTKRRWRLCPRGLYPIAEATESGKDEELTNEKDKIALMSPTALSLNHLNITRDYSSPKPVKNCNIVSSYNLHGVNIWSNTNPYDKSKNNTKAVVSTSNYSACQKLVEDFQRCVTEDAAKVIQCCYRKFRLRKEFIRVRNAAKTIQRYVRNWLQLRHGKQLNDATGCENGISLYTKDNQQDVPSVLFADSSSDTSSGLGVDIESNVSNSSYDLSPESCFEGEKDHSATRWDQTEVHYGISVPDCNQNNVNDWLLKMEMSQRQPPPLVEAESSDIWSDEEFVESNVL